MATRQKKSGGDTLLSGLRNSPQTKLLTEQARHLLDAQAERVAGRVGSGVGTATERLTDKLTEVGQTGQLPGLGGGAKRLLQGDGPVRSALGAAKDGVADKAKGLVQGKGGKGSGEPKAVNIEESLDIGAPVSVVYDQWTQFEDFSRFTKGVESVEQSDDTEMTWRAKVFKSRRSWKARIVEQIADRRIVWTSDGPKGSTKGVVTFHPLADDLTRVLVAIEYYPSGVIEKTGNMWRAGGRRIRLDLKNFRRFVMMENEATGSWRGEIRKGKVVKRPDEDDSRRRGSSSGGRGKSASQTRTSKSKAQPKQSTAGSRSANSAASPQSRKSSPRKSASSSQARKSSPRKSASSSQARKSSPRKSTSSSQARKSSPRKSTSTSRPTKAGSSSARKSTAESRPKKSTSRSRPRKSTAASSRARSSSSRSSSSGAKKSTSARSRGGSTQRPAARKRSS